jgi:choline-sulfatase
VLIVVDQQHPQMAGYAGHADVLTPSLDRLAASGTSFTSAYSSSPLGSVARAGIASGRYTHGERGASGTRRTPGWAHALTEAGYRVTTVGDLHVGAASDSGFGDQRLSMRGHRAGIVGGGRTHGAPPAGQSPIAIGPGEAPYSRFDRAVTAAAVGFLNEDARSEPWALMVSLAAPHLPRTVPREFFDRYDRRPVAAPGPGHHPVGGVSDGLQPGCSIGRPFTVEEEESAFRASLALCTFLDARVGQLLDALEKSGQADDTLVIYTAGHGGSSGTHGPRCADPLSEESVGVPLLIAGQGVAHGHCVDTPVSHVDIAPTILDWAGVTPRYRPGGPGESLLEPTGALFASRAVMAGYGAGTQESSMLRTGRMKYVEHAGRTPKLFDLVADPHEQLDLAVDPDSGSVVAECAARLRELRDADGGMHGSHAALVG